MLFATPALWVPAGVLVGAAAWDARTGRIPDAFPIVLLAWAIASRLLGYQEATWSAPLAGFGVGLALGLLGFAPGWLGGGDGKLLAGLGACIGALGLLATLPWIALVGGPLAFVAGRRGQREVVFGPAIAAGFIIATLL